MVKFNFRLINRSNVLIGNIRRIQKIDEKKFLLLRYCEDICGDYSSACVTTLVKENAIILRLNDEWFIDIDNIKSIKDCERINELLNSEIMDTERFITYGTKKPYIGQLYLDNIYPCEKVENLVTNIVTLKLINKNTQK